uniref:Uncharacterized protein n=1 Tax=Thermodesulfobacterium geofontis TaxID=1295609 RepID=A0A7V5XFV3_9BACT
MAKQKLKGKNKNIAIDQISTIDTHTEGVIEIEKYLYDMLRDRDNDLLPISEQLYNKILSKLQDSNNQEYVCSLISKCISDYAYTHLLHRFVDQHVVFIKINEDGTEEVIKDNTKKVIKNFGAPLH